MLKPGKVAAAMAAVITLACIPQSAPCDDLQYWNEFIFQRAATEKLTVKLAFEQDIVDRISEFALYNATISPSYKLTDWLCLGLEYKHEREKTGEDWRRENRYSALAVLSRTASPWSFKFQAKLEFRDFDEEDSWRWRSKLQVRRNLCIHACKLSVYASDETYHNLDDFVLSQNRAIIGTTARIMDGVDLSLYYLNKLNKRESGWETTNIIGTEFLVSF